MRWAHDIRQTILYSWLAHLVLIPMEETVSSVKRIVALFLATLSLNVLADPLGVQISTSGKVTSVTGRVANLGGAAPGASVIVNFGKEYNTSFATLDANTFTLQPDAYFDAFSISAGGSLLRLNTPVYSASQYLNTIQLQNDVRNAAGDLVDVFVLTAGASVGRNTHYTTTAHLEYASTTFGDLDAWSILAVKDAALLGGTFSLHEVVEGWDGTFQTGHMIVELIRFDVQFTGPGAEVPAVPEPAHSLMLLAGLGALVALRRR